MSRLLIFLAALVGVSLFWCALITEITLRFLPSSFMSLAILVFVACASTGLLFYNFARRVPNLANTSSVATSERTSPNRRSTRVRQGKANANQQGPQRERASNQRAQGKSSSGERPTNRPGSRQNRPPKAAQRNPARSQTRTASRTNGHIKSYSSRQSYGFVVSESGEQAFFHKTNLDSGISDKDLEKERAVSYEVHSGDRGPVATKIRLVSQES